MPSRKSASMLSKAEIKDIRSLHDAKGRSSQQRFIAEGIKGPRGGGGGPSPARRSFLLMGGQHVTSLDSSTSYRKPSAPSASRSCPRALTGGV